MPKMTLTNQPILRIEIPLTEQLEKLAANWQTWYDQYHNTYPPTFTNYTPKPPDPTPKPPKKILKK